MTKEGDTIYSDGSRNLIGGPGHYMNLGCIIMHKMIICIYLEKLLEKNTILDT